MVEMKVKLLLALLLLSMVLVGCSSTRYTESTDEFLSDNFVTGNSGLTIKIPYGWFQAFDNEKNILDLWIVSGDYSASLKFKTIHFDSDKNDLHDAVEISKSVNKIINRNNRKIKDEIKNNTGSFVYRVFEDDSTLARIVIFTWKDKYYECTVNFKPGLQESEKEKIFRLQDEILEDFLDE